MFVPNQIASGDCLFSNPSPLSRVKALQADTIGFGSGGNTGLHVDGLFIGGRAQSGGLAKETGRFDSQDNRENGYQQIGQLNFEKIGNPRPKAAVWLLFVACLGTILIGMLLRDRGWLRLG